MGGPRDVYTGVIVRCKMRPQPPKLSALFYVDDVSLGKASQAFYQILSGFHVPQQIRCPQCCPHVPLWWFQIDPVHRATLMAELVLKAS